MRKDVSPKGERNWGQGDTVAPSCPGVQKQGVDFPPARPGLSLGPVGTAGEGRIVLPGTVDTACSQSFVPRFRPRPPESWAGSPHVPIRPNRLHQVSFPSPLSPAILQLERQGALPPFSCPTRLSSTNSEGGPGSGGCTLLSREAGLQDPTLSGDFSCLHFDPKLARWVRSSLLPGSGEDPAGQASQDGTGIPLQHPGLP